MKYASAAAVLALAVSSQALPLKRSATPTNIDILQFALTLEHLESTFYNGGLAKYSQQDFLDAGFPDWVRPRFEEIAQHEATHVEFLTTTIGSQAVQACTYNFPDTDPKSFVDVSDSLETVGASAYTGAAHFLTNEDYLTAAAAILSTEARQSAWITSAVRKGSPWSTSFETPLDLNQVFSIASGFIVSCPTTNAALPVSTFPPLTIPANGLPGSTVSLNFTSNSTAPLYAAFLSGLSNSTEFAPIGGSDGKTVTIPSDLQGVVYAVVTTQSSGPVQDADTIAGPAMLWYEISSQGKIETLPV